MYISKLAKLTGTTPKAIRLYESLGLLPQATRQGKYRVYTNKDVVLVHMIRRGQAVGFSLQEMKQAIEARAKNDQFPLEMMNDLIIKKQAQLQSELIRIQSQNQQLVELHEEINRTFADTPISAEQT